MLQDFTLATEPVLLSAFQLPDMSANRGLAVEKSLPPKTRTINFSDWSSHPFAAKRSPECRIKPGMSENHSFDTLFLAGN